MSVIPTIRVAYADDSTAVRKGIISFMESLGDISVDIEAGSGVELLEKLGRSALPDVCILDISMPEMDGFDTLSRLKEQYPQMGVLVLTIHKMDYYIIRMIRNGANGYLLKSCDPVEIKKALISICDHGFYYSNTITSRYVHDIRTKKINLPNFTDRELEVWKWSCSDLSYMEIAQKMNTTARSVEGIRDSLFRKLDISSRVTLAMHAVQFGLVPLEFKIPTTEQFLHHK